MLRIAVACALSALFGLGVTGVANASAPTQDDDTTNTSTESGVDGSGEENPLLVPGPEAEESTPADEADAPAVTGEAQVDEAVEPGSTNDEAEDTVRLVMLALIGVAVALTALTAYYWWRTRPSRRAPEPRRRRGTAGDDGDAATKDPAGGGSDTAGTDAAAAESEGADGEDSKTAGADEVDPDSVPAPGDAGTVGAWQTDSTSTR